MRMKLLALSQAMLLVAVAGRAGEPKPVAPPVLMKSFGSGDGNYRASPVVADINGDKRPEIIFSTWNTLHCYSNTGSRMWTHPFAVRNYSGAVVGDLDADGLKEVILGDNKGTVHVLDCRGKPKPGWPQKVHMDPDIRAIACADVDADGEDEVIVFSSLTDKGLQPNMYMFEGNGKVMKGFPHYAHGDPLLGGGYKQAGGFNCNLAVGDITGDGKMEMVCTQDYGSVPIWQSDGQPVWIDKRFKPHSKLDRPHWGEVRAWCDSKTERTKWGQGHDYFMEFTYSPPLIADIDLDGKPEVIAVPNLERGQVGPIKGSALCVWNADRTFKRGFDPTPRVTSAITGEGNAAVEANPVAVAGDIAGDARLELVVAHVDGSTRAYDAAGKELWSVKVITSGAWVMSEPVLADLTGDSQAEVIQVVSHKPTTKSELTVIDGDGKVRCKFSMPFFTLSAPTIADVDGDRRPEMTCAATKPGEGKTIYVYRWPAINPKCVPLPTGRGDFGHTACYGGGPGGGGGAGGLAKYAESMRWSTPSRGLKVGMGVVPGKKAKAGKWLLGIKNTRKRKIVLPKDLKITLVVGGKRTVVFDKAKAGGDAIFVEPGKMLDVSALEGFDSATAGVVPAGKFSAVIELAGKKAGGVNSPMLYLAPPTTPYYWSGSLKTRSKSFSGAE